VHATSLSACAAQYGQTLANPFTGPLGCVPEYPSLPSLKARVYAKGSFSTGAAGFGTIAVDPERSVVNDNSCVLFSTASYAGTTMSTDPTAVGISSAMSNATYAQADIGNSAADVAFRVVGSGLKIRYTGTQLNMGGVKICLHDPTHANLALRTESEMDAEKQSVRISVTREWTTVLYRPVARNELNYRGTIQAHTDTNAFYMGILIQSADPSLTLPFEFEFFTVVEYQGRIVRGQTPTHADPVGAAAASFVTQVSSALQPSNASDHQRSSSIVQHMASYVAHGMSRAQTVSSSSPKAASGALALPQAPSTVSSLLGSMGKVALNLLPEVLGMIF
jgi:hypothetical protein